VAYPAAGVRLPPSATPAELTTDVTRLAALPLRPLPGSAKIARDFAISVLRTWGLPELLPDVSVVVSELVTNAVRHGLRGMAAEPVAPPLPEVPAPIRLAMLRQGCRLRCEVTDPSEVMPVRLEADEDAEIGRGLHLVAALSWDWGATLLAGGGKCVWAIMHEPK
jgi:anti-sigma regulatory factor (Ser/Thr protein kinase)